MKKRVSLILAIFMILSTISTISVSAETINDKGETSGVTNLGGIYNGPAGSVSRRYYFAMPKEWYTFTNATACVYWWDGLDNCEQLADENGGGWQHSYQMQSTPIVAPDGSRVFYVDIDRSVTTVVFGNGIANGTKVDGVQSPNWGKNSQTNFVCVDGYVKNESEIYPDGVDSFDNMIYVIDTNSKQYDALTGTNIYSGEWYYLHEDGTWDENPGSIYEVKRPSVNVYPRYERATVGDTIKLDATFENVSSITEIKWWSEDTDVATVDENGVVTATGEGSTYIVVYVSDIGSNTSRSSSCYLTVDSEDNRRYSVYKLMDNIVDNNDKDIVINGTTYNITLIPYEGYKIDSVEVKMGDKEIIVPYTEDICKISIPKVDGDISIIASASEVESTTEPTTVTTDPTTSTTTSTISTTEPTTSSTTEPTTFSTTEPTTESSTTINTTPSTTTQPTTTKPTVKKVTKVELSKNSVTLLNGKSFTVKATVTPTSATNKKLKWTSSNAKVATVNQSGKITAKGRGTATIKVMALDGSNKYATVKVTVKQPVTSVKLNRKSANLKVKGKAKQKTVTLKATVYPKNANNKSVSWKSSNSKIATVNRKGKVTAKKKGTCFITATAKDGSKKSAKCKIVVK